MRNFDQGSNTFQKHGWLENPAFLDGINQEKWGNFPASYVSLPKGRLLKPKFLLLYIMFFGWRVGLSYTCPHFC